MNNSIVIGVDIGGSHITVALVDLQSRSILKDTFVREHVNSHGTADEIFSAWTKAIKNVISLNLHDSIKIGIAMPNPVDYETGVSYIKGADKYDALYGLNIKTLLADRLHIKPTDIRMSNDAACFLQGEAFGGAAKIYKSAIGLTLGTGIGSAKYHNGLAEDADLWHAPFRGSITEDYLSTRWFLKRYKEVSGNTAKNVKEIASLCDADVNAQIVFAEFAESLAEFLISFINSDKPEVVVIGGNIANASPLFFPAVEKHLAKHNITIPIRKAELGEEAAVVGAASNWYEKKPSSLNSIIVL
jgi:glucokinase